MPIPSSTRPGETPRRRPFPGRSSGRSRGWATTSRPRCSDPWPTASASSALEAETRFSAWESVADWWQTGFTNGADPEYEEQLLPLVRTHIAGCSDVLDVGCGEGQV